MNAFSLFEHWRRVKSPDRSWGLAWFLANEICKRFYASHGIVPWVLDHEGLGYYGITFNRLPCKVSDGSVQSLGRLTINGDVDNWRTGGPGDHGLKAVDLCKQSASTDELIRESIRHLRFEALPPVSHWNCRHKRWGGSYELCFEIATMIALRTEPDETEIWNHPAHTERHIEELDPSRDMAEHPGAFLFRRGERECLVTGDGRLLGQGDTHLWVRFMQGESAGSLADFVSGHLDGL